MTKSKVKLWDRDRLVRVHDEEEGDTVWIHPSSISSIKLFPDETISVMSTNGCLAHTESMSIEEVDAEINRSMEAIVAAESALRQEMTDNVKESIEKLLKEVNSEEDATGFEFMDKIGKDVN